MCTSFFTTHFYQERAELGLRARGWLRSQGLGACDWPLNDTGDRGSADPEQVCPLTRK